MSVATVEWDGDYSLVWIRRHNTSELTTSGEFRREDERRPTKRRAFHGVPARAWLPTKLALRWRSNDYPQQLTRAAIRQWDYLMGQCVHWGRLAEWHQAADEELAEWDHDRQLLIQHKPKLASCFESDVRGDADELLRRAMRIRRKADEYLKALEYGRQVHQQGRDVRGDEYPLDWAKHSQKVLLEELDQLFSRRWRSLSVECGELMTALQSFFRVSGLPVTDAEGFSRLSDRWRDMQQSCEALEEATRRCEHARPVEGWMDAPQLPNARATLQEGKPKPSRAVRQPSERIRKRNEAILAAFNSGASTNQVTEHFKVSADLARKIKSLANQSAKM